MKTKRMHRFQAPERSNFRVHAPQFPVTFEDEIVAKWFGLETARILLDSSYRLFCNRPVSEREMAGEAKPAGAQQR
jgi:hypothetical protein